MKKKARFRKWFLASAAVAGGSLIRSEYEKRQIRFTSYTVRNGKIPPAFAGVRIAVLADLHDCTFGEKNEKLIQRLKELSPDYIVCAGDMIVKNRPFQVENVVAFLGKLTEICPVYCGNGNHEMALKKEYLPDGRSAYDLYAGQLESVGVHVVSDGTVYLKRGEQKVALSGLDLDLAFYANGFHTPMRQNYCEKKLGIPSPGEYHILIGHYPNYFPEYTAWGADLVLAGHMHGGTVRLPFVGGLMSSNFEFFPKYDRGWFAEENCVMIVSGGIGTHSINVRFGNNYPDIPVITLKR
jgi:predicted MPP superfamily phosphohydrolase